MNGGTSSLGTVLSDDTVQPGDPWSGVVAAGAVLRIVDVAGRQGVDFLCYNGVKRP